MKHRSNIEDFKAAISDRLPGYLVLFNFANAKRRNGHLGFDKVDQDIELFNRLLNQAMIGNNYGARVAGNDWLALFSSHSVTGNPVTQIQQLLDDFYQEEEIVVGWQSHGRKAGVEKTQTQTVPAIITRAMRCIYSYLADLDSFNLIGRQLFEQYYGLTVNTPHELQQIIGIPRTDWQCVSRYPAEELVCPFCQGNQFNWLDGDSSYYSYSFCQQCDAEVTFSNDC